MALLEEEQPTAVSSRGGGVPWERRTGREGLQGAEKKAQAAERSGTGRRAGSQGREVGAGDSVAVEPRAQRVGQTTTRQHTVSN